MQRIPLIGLSLWSVAGLAHAQGPVATTPAPTDVFYAPIHTAPDDIDGAYGLWASGHNYKVSFHDGVSFYPVLGESYPKNLPLRWSTSQIKVGDTKLELDRPVTSHPTGWRIELDYGNVIEAYDILRGGVEQTFVLTEKPGDGDLVIVGVTETDLRAQPFMSEHRDLVFFDDKGTAIASYGAATAIDADGNKTAMVTSFDGHAITLTLPATWLSTASYPVTVDPLISTLVLATGIGTARNTDIARDDSANQLLTSYSRIVSASDFDGYARLTADDFTANSLIFTDITASWSTPVLTCAFVGGALEWIIALQRDFAGGIGIRYHTHASADTQLRTTFHSLSYKPGDSNSAPDVGGTASLMAGNKALVVWQEDTGTLTPSSNNSEVWGVLVDVKNTTLGTKFLLSPQGGVLANGNNRDRIRPTVNQARAGVKNSWICCFQEFNNSILNDDWDIMAVRRRFDGSSGGIQYLGNGSIMVHGIAPKIAGRSGRYMVIYGELTNASKSFTTRAPVIRAQRLDWSETSLLPNKQLSRLLRSGGPLRFVPSGIAYDNNTRSHFCAVYYSDSFDVYVDRLGYNAGIAESAVIKSPLSQDYRPSVVFNDDLNEFPIVYSSGAAGNPFRTRIMTYQQAKSTLYGIGCGGAISTSASPKGVPHAGHEFYTVELSGADASTPAALWIALSRGNTPLKGIGAPGCTLLIDPRSLIIGLGGMTSATGALSFAIPLPAPIAGDLFFQYAFLSPGANALGARSTAGLKAEVR